MIRKKTSRRPIIDLTGPEGNAFALLAYARQYARQLSMDVDSIHQEMMSGDYENLLNVFDRHFGNYVILER